MACIDKRAQASIPFLGDGSSTGTTATAFVVASMTYASSVYSYYRVTEGDKHQKFFVFAAFATGITISLAQGLSPVVGLLSLGASGVFLGLLVSDIFHSIASRQSQQNRWSVDERSDNATCDEKLLFLGEEADPEIEIVTPPLGRAEPCECRTSGPWAAVFGTCNHEMGT